MKNNFENDSSIETYTPGFYINNLHITCELLLLLVKYRNIDVQVSGYDHYMWLYSSSLIYDYLCYVYCFILYFCILEYERVVSDASAACS